MLSLGTHPEVSLKDARERRDNARKDIAKVSEGHAERTLIRLEQDAFPWVGATPIAKITAPKLLEALRKIEARGAIETAHRVRHACGQVFRYGIATGRCERDPAADLRDALKPAQEAPAPPISDEVQPLLRFVGNR